MKERQIGEFTHQHPTIYEQSRARTSDQTVEWSREDLRCVEVDSTRLRLLAGGTALHRSGSTNEPAANVRLSESLSATSFQSLAMATDGELRQPSATSSAWKLLLCMWSTWATGATAMTSGRPVAWNPQSIAMESSFGGTKRFMFYMWIVKRGFLDKGYWEVQHKLGQLGDCGVLDNVLAANKSAESDHQWS